MPGSWFVGEVSGRGDRTAFDRLASEKAGSRLVRPHDHVHILIAPGSATCVVEENQESVYVRCGSVPAVTSGDPASPAAPPGQFAALDVHADGMVTVATDANGLRSVYLMRRGERVLFATHVHLLTRLAGRLAVNPERFGSHWFSWCQLSSTFFIDGVERIAGGQRVEIQMPGADGKIRLDMQMPTTHVPASRGASAHAALDKVRSDLRRLGGRGVLALSGGVDSRFLLATGAFREAFVFGSDADLDVIIAREAAAAAGIECTVIPDASLASLVENGLLASYARDNMCISPITAAAHMGNYPGLAKRFPGRILVDGGFGEIGRTQYLQRFELLRRSFWLRLGGLDACVSALSSTRCDVFTEEIRRRMQEGVRRDVELFMEELARLDAAPSDAARAEDHIAARYRRQNFFGHGQAWIDSFAPNYMPLAQEPFVQNALKAPLSERRGSRAVRSWIRRHNAHLARVDLSSRGVRIPFGVPPVLVPAARRAAEARLRRAVAARRAATTSQAANHPLLHARVRELVHDTCLAPRSWYDPVKVSSLVEGFYAGNMNLAPAVAWLLSLELWLRGNEVEA